MAKKANTKEEIDRKKKLAYTLFVVNGFNQKVIAEQTGISERSIHNWKTEGDWESDREEERMGFEPQRKRLRKMFDATLEIIEQREHPNNVPNNAEADRLNKLADAVKKLQTELSFQHKAEAGKLFIQYVQQTHGQAKAIEVVDLWHEYLMATA
jgi:transposase